MIIREETSADHAGIRALNRLAFDGVFESRLIDRLRAEELVLASLVALDGEDIAGHILFSRLGVTVDGWTVRAAALAPMSVMPERQRQGIGSALVRAGLEAVSSQGIEAVFVLGHPAYYPRFGFSPAVAAGLASPYNGDAFMALELAPDALRGGDGVVTYPDAFDPE
ncbi:MAG: GNAT family N-acetyltransferase [Sphingomonadales bacterium]